MASKDLENEIKTWTEDIKRLKREITDLKNYIDIKEKELSETRLEKQQLNSKLSPKVSKIEIEPWESNINKKIQLMMTTL